MRRYLSLGLFRPYWCRRGRIMFLSIVDAGRSLAAHFRDILKQESNGT